MDPVYFCAAFLQICDVQMPESSHSPRILWTQWGCILRVLHPSGPLIRFWVLASRQNTSCQTCMKMNVGHLIWACTHFVCSSQINLICIAHRLERLAKIITVGIILCVKNVAFTVSFYCFFFLHPRLTWRISYMVTFFLLTCLMKG